MTQLMQASRQLCERPSDEHFESFDALRQSARASRDNGRQVDIDPRAILFRPDDTQPGGVGVSLSDSLPAVSLSYHSARQLAGFAGASPAFVFERLSPKTAALALNEGIRNGERGSSGPERMVALIDRGRLRAVNSQTYNRVWDADLLDIVHEWLLPHGFYPALPTKNTDAQRNNIFGNNKPALFRGDLDSFSFFMSDGDATDGGNRPVRRGVFITNSEVVVRSIGVQSFVFDDVCANFIVWGARAQRRMRIVHRKGKDAAQGGDVLRRFRDEIRRLTPTMATAELAMLDKAAETMFAQTRDKAEDRLVTAFGTTQKLARSILERADFGENQSHKAGTHAHVAAGATSLAKEEVNADAIMALATLGGDIIASATPVAE